MYHVLKMKISRLGWSVATGLNKYALLLLVGFPGYLRVLSTKKKKKKVLHLPCFYYILSQLVKITSSYVSHQNAVYLLTSVFKTPTSLVKR